MKINSLLGLMAHKNDIPENVYQDVMKRLYDWVSSNGNVDDWVKDEGPASDDYIKRQFQYAEHFLINNYKKEQNVC